VKFDFNLESSLLLLGFTQGMVYGGLLLWRGFTARRLSDRFLGCLLIVICLHLSHYMLGFAGWFNTRDAYTTFMFYFPIENMLWVGPLVYYYFRSLTNREFKMKRRDWYHFLPGGIHLALLALVFTRDIVVQHWIIGEPLQCFEGTRGDWACYYEDQLEIPIQMLWTVSITLYLYLTLRDYQRYRTYLNNHFSAQEGIQFGWLRNLLLILGVGLVITWGYDLYGFIVGEWSHSEYWYTHLILAAATYIVCIQGYHTSVKEKELNFINAKDKPVEETPLSVEVPEEEEPKTVEVKGQIPQPEKPAQPELLGWVERVKAFMEEEEPYLNPELNLKQLAKAMQTNHAVLSRVINSGFGQNFNDFINSKRVEAVKCKMEDPASAHYSLLGIANECGFNSKSTFNRAFKKFSGVSPRDFMQSLQNEQQ